jgi:mannose-6-phosphate isomerase-like protein (cupin superfamily)
VKPTAKSATSKSKAARSSARTRAIPAAKYKLNPSKHRVMVKYAKDIPWETGLRGHMAYRDTGIGAATNGEFGAFVMRPRHPGVPIAHPHKHFHSTSFQMVYILEGTARFWLDGLGEISVAKGDCFYQPDGLLHQAIEISDDLELLEITMPLEFETVTP